jgi:hypothetical protein
VRFVFITHRKTLVLNRISVAGVLGMDPLARLRDYVLAHLDKSIEVAALGNLAGRNSFHFTRIATWSILNPLGFLMLSAGLLSGGKPVFTGTIDAPPKDHTAQYGEYIISYLDCRECHDRNLTGGIVGQLPPMEPDLNLVKDWKLEDFVTARPRPGRCGRNQRAIRSPAKHSTTIDNPVAKVCRDGGAS